MGFIIYLTLTIMTVALLLCFYRAIAGPSLPDRVMALEMFAMIVVCMIGIHAISSDVPAFLDVAIVLALMSFLATVGFARFLERGGQRDD